MNIPAVELAEGCFDKKIDQAMSIGGLTTRKELDFLMRQAFSSPHEGRILELGTFAGRTTAALCMAVGSRRVLSLDNYVMQHHGASSLAQTQATMTSMGLHPKLLAIKSQNFMFSDPLGMAMLFVDSQHRPDTVIIELTNFTPHIPVGGRVVLHDYAREEFPGYTEAINMFFDSVCWSKPTICEAMVSFTREAITG